MKTPEEIKKGLVEAVAEMFWATKYGDDNDMRRACGMAHTSMADALVYIQQLEARVPRWISVEERLPERGITKCSACVKCGDGLKRVVCASYNAELKLWTGWHGEKIGNEITHWMPLPEPPEEEKRC